MPRRLAASVFSGVAGRSAAPKEICSSPQLAQGGLVLWVAVGDDATSARGLEILIKAGARDAHLHEIQREWTLKDQPSVLGQPNPFLGSDPVAP